MNEVVVGIMPLYKSVIGDLYYDTRIPEVTQLKDPLRVI